MAKVAWFKRLFQNSVKPTALVNRSRFVDLVGDQIATAGAKARGISQDKYDPAVSGDNSGDKLTITIIGIEELETGGAFSFGARLASDNVGRGVLVAANQAVNAIALDASTGVGDRVPALLISGYEPQADLAGGATLGDVIAFINAQNTALRTKL